MSKINQWVALGVLAVLAVLAGGWFLLVAPDRSEAEALRVQAEEQAVANDRARTQLQVLQAQADALPEQRARLADVAARIPDQAQLPALIRALTDAAEDGDVEFVSLVPGTPVPLAAPAPVAVAGSEEEGATPVAPSTTAAGSTAGSLHAIPVTLNVVGGYYQVERYVAALEDLPRALRITGLTLAPGDNPVAPPQAGGNVDDGRSLAAVITGTVFLAPGQAPLPTGTAPAPAAATGGTSPGAAAPTTDTGSTG